MLLILIIVVIILTYTVGRTSEKTRDFKKNYKFKKENRRFRKR